MCAETLQMSHDYSWRGVCASTTRNSRGRWLWRLVRLLHVDYLAGDSRSPQRIDAGPTIGTSHAMISVGRIPRFSSFLFLRTATVAKHAIATCNREISWHVSTMPSVWKLILISFMMRLFAETLQMSRDRSWRDTCVSTGRDSCGRWLWRLVGLSFVR